MLTLSTNALTFTETRSAPFVANAPSVTIILPDGTAEANAPLVAATASEDGLTQTLSASYVPPQGGAYGLLWRYAEGGAGPIQRPGADFAFWTDVPTFVRATLQVKPARVSDAQIGAEFARTVRILLLRFADSVKCPCLGRYDRLQADDRKFFDEAAGFITAVQLWDVKMNGATGLVDQVKVGQVSFSYGQDKTDPRNRWTDQAALSLGYISCIAAQQDREVAAFSPYAISGPTRQANADGRVQGLLATVQAVYDDPGSQSLL